MQPIIKTRSKAEAEEAQRRYFWSLTPYERVALAVKLNRQARAIYAANPANSSLDFAPHQHGRRVLKSTTPIPRDRR
ncbi:hypothetical protein GCM10011375_00670 [Hymenobacter qilianensis]|uniref:Uncharacterized protein n=2 Tax=Hymenobacter qilianensis TaxID=1385715 RepID=A0A7H0GRP7_9BACT|nr:hypothetical protein [Hymenobacter qilianensis]QNP50963.1 hypothetical protein H9L05_12505 [Hymenobacter qilianensis]GGF49033.1 hypothetical protein GCM10011375_00670 [Hymenobacter qilianensis]